MTFCLHAIRVTPAVIVVALIFAVIQAATAGAVPTSTGALLKKLTSSDIKPAVTNRQHMQLDALGHLFQHDANPASSLTEQSSSDDIPHMSRMRAGRACRLACNDEFKRGKTRRHCRRGCRAHFRGRGTDISLSEAAAFAESF